MSITPEAMCDQQHFAVFPAADLLDDVEMLLDLQMSEALCRQFHQLIDQAAISEAQLNHLYPHRGTTKQVHNLFTNLTYAHTSKIAFLEPLFNSKYNILLHNSEL